MKLDHKSLLIEKYHELLNWEPDYEECGIQFGPSDDKIQKVVDAIRQIDPEWKTPEEKRGELKESYNIILNFGKYKGFKISDIPVQYLNWLVSQSWLDPDIQDSIFHYYRS